MGALLSIYRLRSRGYYAHHIPPTADNAPLIFHSQQFKLNNKMRAEHILRFLFFAFTKCLNVCHKWSKWVVLVI